jgi:hypothetical protein
MASMSKPPSLATIERVVCFIVIFISSERQALQALGPSRCKCDAQRSTNRLAEVMNLVDAKCVEECLHVEQQLLGGSFVLETRVGRLTVATHIASQNPQIAGQQRNSG